MSFVKRTVENLDKKPEFEPKKTLGRSKLSETLFDESEIEAMRKIYRDGGIVSLRMPVPVTDISGQKHNSLT